MKKLLSTFALATLVLSACSANTEETAQVMESPIPEEYLPVEEPLVGGYTTPLVDSESGEELGSAYMTEGGGYTYITANAQLPLLEDDFFYEGWIVRSEPLSVISTGAFTFEDYGNGVHDFDNFIEFKEDYTDHLKYIITLEPDDGDPAPAAHVAEGTLTAQ